MCSSLQRFLASRRVTELTSFTVVKPKVYESHPLLTKTLSLFNRQISIGARHDDALVVGFES